MQKSGSGWGFDAWDAGVGEGSDAEASGMVGEDGWTNRFGLSRGNTWRWIGEEFGKKGR